RRAGGRLLQALVSLHDVTPVHRARLDRAEALLARTGIDRVAFFLVPDYHGAHPAARDTGFVTWCSRERPFAGDWVLHGYYHRDDDASARSAPRQWLARHLLTDGEGEFLTLTASVQRDRLRLARRVAGDVLGVVPRAFVAPAWLFNDALVPALRDLGFR